MGRYWEEFDVSDEFLTPGRTLTEADLMVFAGISGDFNELHTNRSYCEMLGLPGLVPQTNLVIAIASGLVSRLGLFDGTGVGLTGLSWTVHRSVWVGDTLRCRVRIVELEPQDDDTGALVREVEVLNEHDEVLQTGRHHVLVRRRPAQGSSRQRKNQ